MNETSINSTVEKRAGARRLLSVGEVAQRSGVPISTIHFYEEKGLIQSRRNSANHRQFPAIVLRYIAIIRVAQSTGISLDEIKESFKQFNHREKVTTEDWKVASSQWRDNLDQRIQKLTRLRDELGSCIGCGCLSLTECPLRNPDDILGEEGAGARILERE